MFNQRYPKKVDGNVKDHYDEQNVGKTFLKLLTTID